MLRDGNTNLQTGVREDIHPPSSLLYSLVEAWWSLQIVLLYFNLLLLVCVYDVCVGGTGAMTPMR